MYEYFYQLKAEPFRLSPDHQFCYSHEGYARAKAYMAYAFVRAEGFVMVTGRPGTGKTTLIGDLIESLADERVTTASLVCTQLGADDLLRMVAFAFGMDVAAQEKSQVLQRLTTLFNRLHQQGRRALLIVDEAQDLPESALEELRLLTNLQVRGEPLLQIFLLGQEELRDLIQRPSMSQVQQRIVATCHLQSLKLMETREYILHRLLRVGWKGNPKLSEALYPIIYRFSDGVPRRINLICSRLFLHGSVEQRDRIGVADAKDVISELQMEQLATGSLLNEVDFSVEDEYLSFTAILSSMTGSDVSEIMETLAAEAASAQLSEREKNSASDQGDVADASSASLGAANDSVSTDEHLVVQASELDQNAAANDEIVIDEKLTKKEQSQVSDNIDEVQTVAGGAALVSGINSQPDEIGSDEPIGAASALDQQELERESVRHSLSPESVVGPMYAGKDRDLGQAVAVRQGMGLGRTLLWGAVAALATAGVALCLFYWQFTWQ